MIGYGIEYCDRDRDNYSRSESRTEHGIYLNREQAETKVAELNEPFKQEWDKQRKQMKKDIEKEQKKWDVLKAAGCAEGYRPVMLDFYNKEWEKGNSPFYSIEEIDIHESELKELTKKGE